MPVWGDCPNCPYGNLVAIDGGLEVCDSCGFSPTLGYCLNFNLPGYGSSSLNGLVKATALSMGGNSVATGGAVGGVGVPEPNLCQSADQETDSYLSEILSSLGFAEQEVMDESDLSSRQETETTLSISSSSVATGGDAVAGAVGGVEVSEPNQHHCTDQETESYLSLVEIFSSLGFAEQEVIDEDDLSRQESLEAIKRQYIQYQNTYQTHFGFWEQAGYNRAALPLQALAIYPGHYLLIISRSVIASIDITETNGQGVAFARLMLGNNQVYSISTERLMTIEWPLNIKITVYKKFSPSFL